MVPARSARRRALRTAALRRLRAGPAATPAPGEVAAGPGLAEVAAAAAAHHAALLRLATRALEAYCVA
eukprot:10442206-Alexandrium_andersonii.AAC.1